MVWDSFNQLLAYLMNYFSVLANPSVNGNAGYQAAGWEQEWIKSRLEDWVNEFLVCLLVIHN